MSKVLVIVPFPLDEEGVENRRAQLREAGVSDSTEFVFRPVKAGPRLFDSEHDALLGDVALTEVGIAARDEGFDAICIDSLSDSGLGAMRSVFDIPVVGPGRSAILTAMMLGEKFSFITMWEPWSHTYKKTLKSMGLESFCASVRWPTGLVPDFSKLLGGKEEEVFPKLLETSQQCIADGADVIILGSTTMHEAQEFLSQHLPVPVINPGPLSYKLAELFVSLRLTQSRLAYPNPAQPQYAGFTRMLEALADEE